MANVCSLISNKLEELLPLSTEYRILKANKIFQAVMMYPCKEDGSFIVQCFHEGNTIDWLETKKGGVDLQGYGVFALQDIFYI